MKFITLGSSSAGNGYLLRASDGETLIIEAGVKLMNVKKALDFDLSGVIGCIVSHSHNDHSGHIEEYQSAGINCYMNEATRQIKFPDKQFYNVYELKEKTVYDIGSFKVQPISLKHDVPNFGYLINHSESGLFIFLTDTHYCPYKFPGMNNILVECNYSDAILERNIQNGKSNMYVRNRVIKSHMEMDTTIGFLKANDLSKVNNIVLLHLSDGNSDSAASKKQIAELTGKSVYVAEPGLNIEFNKTSF